ncbi:hypothetical protein N9374_02805 [Candidatus Pelagibacter sp.]|nr:hypothetical protein [Candidatus Pelagibacter sp.]
MKLKTFYKIYYEHRFRKKSLILKLYIFILLPINYLINKILLQSKLNLDTFAKKNDDLYDKNFKYLVEYFNSDKGETYLNQYNKPIKQNKSTVEGHCYHTFYEKYFSDRREQISNILEIGAFKGNATASFFFYFSNSKIISGDIFPDLFRYNSNRISNIYLDNSSEQIIEDKILNKKIKFDIIIEDAGHYFKDQIISLFMLFKTLNSKGVFVVEELEFPNLREDMNLSKEKPTLRDILNLIIKGKDFSSRYITDEQKKYFLQNYKTIEIFKGRTSEIAFITKK